MIVETLDFHSNFLLVNDIENNDPKNYFELLIKYFQKAKWEFFGFCCFTLLCTIF